MFKMNTSGMISVCLLISLLLAVQCAETDNRIMIVPPSAINIILSQYEQILVLFTTDEGSDKTRQAIQNYNRYASEVNNTFPKDDTFYAVTSIDLDNMHQLEEYNRNPGVRLIRKIAHYVYEEQYDSQELQHLIEFYENYVHPQLPEKLKEVNGFELQFVSDCEQQTQNHTIVYRVIYDNLRKYQIQAAKVTLPKSEESIRLTGLYLYKNSSLIGKYSGDIFDYEQLNYYLNVQTLPYVGKLNSDNYYRFFMKESSLQIMLIYRPQDEYSTIVQQVRQQLWLAAEHNRLNELFYQRVFFCEADSQFMLQHFGEGIDSLLGGKGQDSYPFRLLATVTSYDQFQLLKYLFHQKESITSAKISEFIQDIRMKRIDPEYKSEEIPDQSENTGVLRKIVGKSFIREVYEKSDQSILILFYDSKMKAGQDTLRSKVQELVMSYRKLLTGQLTCAIFDLDKNEHQFIKICEAPSLVLFERTNKKAAIIYRGIEVTVDSLRKWLNNQMTHLVIPEDSVPQQSSQSEFGGQL